VPLDEYLRRRQPNETRRPAYVGPPLLQYRDLTGGRAATATVTAERDSLATSATRSWEGIQQTIWSPPSPSIAVGPEDVMLAVNTSIARFTREGAQTDLFTAEQWFAPQMATICPLTTDVCSFFDPALHYDQLQGRFLFLLSAANDSQGRSYFLLSVSNGATFAGGWRTWVLDGQLNGAVRDSQVTLDFAQMGFDNQAVYLTGDMFNFFGVLRYSKIRILKKSELYNAATTTLTYKDFWDMRNADDTIVTSPRPVHLRGQVGEATAPGYVLNAADTVASDKLTLWQINNPVGADPQLERFTISGLWPYSDPLFATQPNSTRLVNAGDTRIPRAILRNGAIYLARGTGYVDEPTTVTYERIDVASRKATLQARMIGGGFFFPAFDVPATLGPGNQVPALTVVGTNVNEQGQLTFLGIRNSKAGEALWEVSGSASRWGDFFSATIDPVDGGLWTYGEYAKARNANEGGRWGTWASYFPWSAVQPFSDVGASDFYSTHVSAMRLWGITGGCDVNPLRYCPSDTLRRGQMAVFLVRALYGDSFSFPAEPYFTDVPATHTFFKYIQKLRQSGITTGCTATTYCPDDTVTRGQMAVFVVRAKMRAVLGDTFAHPTPAYFTDVPVGHAWFPFVQKLRELGVTSGCSATEFCTNDPITRAQTAVFLVRALLN
jgi:hypothetical protein